MKMKVEKDRKWKTEHLVVKTTKGENLDYAQAELLCGNSCLQFLPFSYKEKKGEAKFIYDLTDTIPIETYLEAKLSFEQFRTLLQDVADVLEVCSNLGLDSLRLLFEVGTCRISVQTERAAFAYVPAGGLKDRRRTVEDLLRHTAECTTFVCEDNKKDADALLDFLRRNAVFSALDFRKFLSDTAFGAGKEQAGNLSAGPTPLVSVAAYDFVKVQAGVLSVEESYKAKTLAERVSAEVASSEAHTSVPTFAPVAAHAGAPTSPAPSADAPILATAAPPTDAPPPETAAPPELATPSSFSSDAPPTNTPSSASGFTPAPSTPPIYTSSLTPAPSLAYSSDIAKAANSTVAEPFFLVRLTTGMRYELDPSAEISVGRSKRCDICVGDNERLSRKHVVLAVSGDICFIHDCGSLNKTYVGGVLLEPFTQVSLARGTVFRLADEDFALQ